MATDKLINQTQGDDIIDALSDIATNVSNITYGPQTSADKVVSMIGYAEAAEAASINPGDTLNEAIGKLEKKADDNATAVADKIDKVANPTTGAIATLTATGEIADSEVEISTSLTDSSDAEVPTSKAVGTYVAGKGYAVGVNSSTANNLVSFNDANGKALKDSGIAVATSTTGLADSDTAVPTSKTVKTYVDSTATGISRYLGTITAASQLSTSAKKGDFYVVKTAWSGVHAGDEIIAEKDNPSQTIDGTNWSLLHNEADTDTKYTFATGNDNGTFLVTPSDTGTAQPVSIKGLGSTAYTTADTSSLTNDNNHVPTSALAKTLLDDKVPTTRKVNNKALSSDITLSASDVSAVPTGNVTTTLPASSAAASTSKVMSEKLVYDTYVPNSDLVEVVDNGVKNLLHFDDSNTVIGNFGGFNINGLNAITVYGKAAWAKSVTSVSLSPGTYEFMFTIESTDVSMSIDIHNEAINTNYYIEAFTTTGTYTREFTIPTGVSPDVITCRVTCNNSTTAQTDVVTTKVSNVMICTKSQFNISPTYQPYALPNTAITPELIELCDSGAKNLWNFANASLGQSSNETHTKTDTSITVSSTGAWAYVSYELPLKTGHYVFSATISNLTVPTGSSPMIRIADTKNGSTSRGQRDIRTTGNLSFEFEITQDSTYYVIFGSNWVATSYTAGYTATNLMCCTKAAFGVSSKFVPYRPNWDLVGNTVKSVNDTFKRLDYGSNNVTTISVNVSTWQEGTYLVACNNATSNTSIKGTSVYMFTLRHSLNFLLFTKIAEMSTSESSNSNITNMSINNDTITISYEHTGYHSVYAVKL